MANTATYRALGQVGLSNRSQTQSLPGRASCYRSTTRKIGGPQTLKFLSLHKWSSMAREGGASLLADSLDLIVLCRVPWRLLSGSHNVSWLYNMVLYKPLPWSRILSIPPGIIEKCSSIPYGVEYLFHDVPHIPEQFLRNINWNIPWACFLQGRQILHGSVSLFISLHW